MKYINKLKGLRVSYPFSSIFFAPKVYCDQNSYFYDDDLSNKTVDAHKYINSHILNKKFFDLGCDFSKYKKGTRAYVLIRLEKKLSSKKLATSVCYHVCLQNNETREEYRKKIAKCFKV